jgi:hypothetical protein
MAIMFRSSKSLEQRESRRRESLVKFSRFGWETSDERSSHQTVRLPRQRRYTEGTQRKADGSRGCAFAWNVGGSEAVEIEAYRSNSGCSSFPD